MRIILDMATKKHAARNAACRCAGVHRRHAPRVRAKRRGSVTPNARAQHERVMSIGVVLRWGRSRLLCPPDLKCSTVICPWLFSFFTDGQRAKSTKIKLADARSCGEFDKAPSYDAPIAVATISQG